jgi:hypothetical protein
MFPGYGARVEYNEYGEPLGWDYPSDDSDDSDDSGGPEWEEDEGWEDDWEGSERKMADGEEECIHPGVFVRGGAGAKGSEYCFTCRTWVPRSEL